MSPTKGPHLSQTDVRSNAGSAEPRHLYGTGYGADRANNLCDYVWGPVLRRLAGLPAGSRVLDAGCGNGHFARELRERGLSVCGLDLEESGVLQARRLCPDIRFAVASVYDDIRALFGQEFDAVISLEVIEHLYDPRMFIRRIRECLSVGGLLVLSTPYHGYLKNLLIALTGKFDAHVSPLWDGGHIKFWSPRTLCALLEEGGFRFQTLDGAGRVPYLWKSMIITCKAI